MYMLARLSKTPIIGTTTGHHNIQTRPICLTAIAIKAQFTCNSAHILNNYDRVFEILLAP